jgi:GTP cyclohydrolase I
LLKLDTLNDSSEPCTGFGFFKPRLGILENDMAKKKKKVAEDVSLKMPASTIGIVDASQLNGGLTEPDNPTEKREAVMDAVRTILLRVGEDPDREGLQRTPLRVAKMYDELLAGYTTDLDKLVNEALFNVQYDEMIIVKNIEYFSFCEHHMLPFFGLAHVAYIPKDRVIGLSKIPRIVDMFARRLQVQERMTQQIADTISQVLDPKGVAVVIEGSHMCAMMRGVRKEHSRMITSSLRGLFKSSNKTRAEFMAHVDGGKGETIF